MHIFAEPVTFRDIAKSSSCMDVVFHDIHTTALYVIIYLYIASYGSCSKLQTSES